MIEFKNLNQEIPYLHFKKKYDDALNNGQKSIEAISISSYNKEMNEVDSRYVNLKFIKNDEFIFFSNYDSPKAASFSSHKQIAALIYWSSINVQIRMRAKITKTSNEFNQEYFSGRSEKKNALAISSNQSKQVSSYDVVKESFYKSLNNDNLKHCPDYWGGYRFVPYYFEFWEGEEFRLNKREVFQKKQNNWISYLLQP
tara:strand:- start:2317 stop:2913 length:597 start_codon:yes stop_codon:yes gene_type:complete